MIYGNGVRLRALERSDVPIMTSWFNNPEVRSYLLMHEPMSLAKEEGWFEALLASSNDFVYGIEAQVGDKWVYIGNTGLHRVDWVHRSAVFGIVIGEQAYWGKGYGTAATRALVGFAFNTLNLHRVQLDVFDFNVRARRAYEKVGFRLEGTRRQALFHDGAYHDEHLMAILSTEFADESRQV
ncbi:MAG: GNAT family protein [Anaerolineae bacterium]